LQSLHAAAAAGLAFPGLHLPPLSFAHHPALGQHVVNHNNNTMRMKHEAQDMTMNGLGPGSGSGFFFFPLNCLICACRRNAKQFNV